MSLSGHLGVLVAAGAFLAATSAQNPASPLTLHDAVSIALEKNPLRKAALADTRARLMDEAATHQLDRTEQEVVFHPDHKKSLSRVIRSAAALRS